MARFAPSLLLTLAAALPGVAYAGSPFDSILGGADAVELPGSVDVPLYSAPWGGSSVGVFLNVGEERFFVQVLPGASSIYLNAGAVGKLGAKVKDKEVNHSEYKYTTLDQAKLGDVVLEDLRVLTTEKEISNLSDAVREETPEGVGFDGHIGLGALTDKLAWALLLDEGVLRLAPADQGAGLVSGLGGQTLKTRSIPSTKLKFGEDKAWSLPAAIVATVDLGGNQTEAVLSWALHTSILDTELALADELPSSTQGDRVFRYAESGLDGAKEPTWIQHTSGFSYLNTDDGPLVPYRGLLGRDVLEELSVAYDPATGDLAYKRADKPQRKDPLPELLADAQAALDKSLEPAEDAAADAEPPKGDKGAWKRVAEIKEDMGDFDGAIEALTKITEIDEDSCDGWHDLGVRQWTAGDLDGAQASLEKAATLFDAWWSTDIPLSPEFQKLDEREVELENRKHLAAKSREEWSELIAKAEKKGVEPSELGVPEGLKPQPGAVCKDINANLAGVLLAKGEATKVADLWSKRADWDSSLPLYAGSAALVAGDLDAAAAAYRQNSKMNLSTEAHSRVGLAVVAAKQGRWDDGKKLMARANSLYQDDVDLRAWLSLRAEKNGAVGAAKEAAQLSDAHPGDMGTAVIWAEWAKAAGDEGKAAAAVKRAKALTAQELRHDPDFAYAIALNARLALVEGDTAAARKGAERAIKLAPGAAWAHATLSEVQAAEGDTAKATATMKKAAGLAPATPYYAMKLGGK
jgi:tetratricopeptide (TPR) repeat protein